MKIKLFKIKEARLVIYYCIIIFVIVIVIVIVIIVIIIVIVIIVKHTKWYIFIHFYFINIIII